MGTKAEVPREIRKANVAAFLVTLLWSGPNKAWPGLLAAVPILLWRPLGVIPESAIALPQLAVAIWAAKKGNLWAWRYRRWDSVEHFLRVQRRWAWAAVIITICSIGLLAWSKGTDEGSVPGASDDAAEVTPQVEEPVRFQPYSNASKGLSLQYPSDWSVDEGEGAIVALQSPPDGLFDDYTESVVLFIGATGSRMSLDKFESRFQKGLTRDAYPLTDVQLLSSERVALDGRLAYEDHFTGRFTSGPAKGLESELLWLTEIVGNKAYVIAFVAEPGDGYDSWLPMARRIIDSIVLADDHR